MKFEARLYPNDTAEKRSKQKFSLENQGVALTSLGQEHRISHEYERKTTWETADHSGASTRVDDAPNTALIATPAEIVLSRRTSGLSVNTAPRRLS